MEAMKTIRMKNCLPIIASPLNTSIIVIPIAIRKPRIHEYMLLVKFHARYEKPRMIKKSENMFAINISSPSFKKARVLPLSSTTPERKANMPAKAAKIYFCGIKNKRDKIERSMEII